MNENVYCIDVMNSRGMPTGPAGAPPRRAGGARATATTHVTTEPSLWAARVGGPLCPLSQYGAEVLKAALWYGFLHK
jgi:hypothetical protein